MEAGLEPLLSLLWSEQLGSGQPGQGWGRGWRESSDLRRRGQTGASAGLGKGSGSPERWGLAEAFSVASEGPVERPSLLLRVQIGVHERRKHRRDWNEIQSDGCKLECDRQCPLSFWEVSLVCSFALGHNAMPPPLFSTHKGPHKQIVGVDLVSLSPTTGSCSAEKRGPGNSSPIFPWTFNEPRACIFGTVMKSFQEMGSRVKYIAAAT